MTIKTVTTWLKSTYIPEDMHDTRHETPSLPPQVQANLKKWIDEGKYPATRQPEDSIEITDEHIIVTTVWFDAEAAQTWVQQGLSSNIPDLVDRIIVVD